VSVGTEQVLAGESGRLVSRAVCASALSRERDQREERNVTFLAVVAVEEGRRPFWI